MNHRLLLATLGAGVVGLAACATAVPVRELQPRQPPYRPRPEAANGRAEFLLSRRIAQTCRRALVTTATGRPSGPVETVQPFERECDIHVRRRRSRVVLGDRCR
jgi:hypothetical protein